MSLSFSELLEPIAGLTPGQLQEHACKRFPDIVAQSHMEIWLPDDSPFEPHDQAVLIGVATGIGKVFQTPVVGFWKNGELTERLSGAAAREWLVDRYKLFTK